MSRNIWICKNNFHITGETWHGKWQGNEIAAKILAVRECTPRISRDFNDEYPKLRIFSHPNVMPVIGCCNSPPNLVVISQYVQIGSLYQVLHEGSGLVVDATAAIQFAIDVAKGMAFLQSLDRQLPRYYLNSRHVMVRNNLDYLLSINFRAVEVEALQTKTR